jgi:hypothetical protein
MMCGQAVACEVMDIWSFKAGLAKSGPFVSELDVCPSTFWVEIKWTSAGASGHDHWLDNWIVEVWKPGVAGGTGEGYPPSGTRILRDDDVPWNVLEDANCPSSSKVGAFEIDASGWEPGAYELRAWVRRDAGTAPYIWEGSPACTVSFIKLVVEAPDDITSGELFTVTVKAVKCSDESIYAGYRGTITFSTDDGAPNITLPANYTFTAGDAGSHTFTSAVKLRTVDGTGHTRWLKAEDIEEGAAPGEDTMNVWFEVGATVEFYQNCPHPGGALSYGATTACVEEGLPPDSVFVALPSTTVSCDTQVIVKYGGNTETAPLKDRGPKTTSDAYWNDDGIPAFPNRAIDLSDGLADDLGMSYGCNGDSPFGGGTVKWRFQ